MVQFETIKAEEVKFGNNNFLEVARKKAITEDGTENTFISLSRGFVTPTGEKRYRKSFTIPMDDAVIDFVAEQLKKV